MRGGQEESMPLWGKDGPVQADDRLRDALKKRKGTFPGPAGKMQCYRKQCPNEALMQQDGRVTSQRQTR